jgi:LemA protein
MKGLLIGLLVLAIAAGGVFVVGTGLYNAIVAKSEAIPAKWAQVENQLQRRYDLIPNLVNSVKGYAQHEQEIFENVTNARSQWAQAGSVDEKVKAAATLDSAVMKLVAIAENYPDLKADGTFLKLMDELAGTENRVATERMRYNEAVREYNVMVKGFPGNLIGKLFGYEPRNEYFRVEDLKRSVPDVLFTK